MPVLMALGMCTPEGQSWRGPRGFKTLLPILSNPLELTGVCLTSSVLCLYLLSSTPKILAELKETQNYRIRILHKITRLLYPDCTQSLNIPILYACIHTSIPIQICTDTSIAIKAICAPKKRLTSFFDCICFPFLSSLLNRGTISTLPTHVAILYSISLYRELRKGLTSLALKSLCSFLFEVHSPGTFLRMGSWEQYLSSWILITLCVFYTLKVSFAGYKILASHFFP